VVQDLRYAVRTLKGSPRFTAIALLSLALGIGANTAIFSIINEVLIRELPLREPGDLVEIYTTEEGGEYSTSSWADYPDVSALTEVFEGVTGYELTFASVDTDEGSQSRMAELVSGNFFSELGVPMAVGRGFTPEEDQVPGRDAVMVLSHRYWRESFGGSTGVIGQTLRVKGRPFTVVGVASERFKGLWPVLTPDFWAPRMMADHFSLFATESSLLDSRGSRSMFMKGRLREGVSVDQAREALAALTERLREIYPEVWDEGETLEALSTLDVRIHPLVDRAVVPVAGLLMAVVGLVLLIACTNLAGFLLARGTDRQRDLAVQMALGARRSRLVRQMLTETLLLSILGGALGVLLAYWVLGVFSRVELPSLITLHLDFGLDSNVLLFAAVVSVGAGLFFGLLPALASTRTDVAPVLKDESGAVAGGRRRAFLRSVLVVTQVAISLVLLVSAGLFVRSLVNAQSIDPGFHAPEAGMVWLDLSGRYGAEEARVAYRELEERARALPAVKAAALASRLPLGQSVGTTGVTIPGVEPPPGREYHSADITEVSPGYLDLMRIPVLSGRGFDASDVEGSEPVVMVNEAMARRFWPGEDPVGKVIERGSTELRIVGVTRTTKVRTLGEAPRPQILLPLAQEYSPIVAVLARGREPPELVVNRLRGLVREYNPDISLMSGNTMEQHLSLMLLAPKAAAALLAALGSVALLLASIGLYGLVSYTVSRRNREVGIRVSLGADHGDVIRALVGGGVRLVAWGIALGLLLALGATQLVDRFLYGVGATDPLTFIGVPALFAGITLLAAYIPARRASRVDPVEALRAE
jgi:predicted permease